MLDILNCPVDGMSLELLVDPKHKTYQELAVTKDPDRKLEIQVGLDQCLQAVDGVPHSKAFCLIICLARPVVAPGANYLLSFAI